MLVFMGVCVMCSEEAEIIPTQCRNLTQTATVDLSHHSKSSFSKLAGKETARVN